MYPPHFIKIGLPECYHGKMDRHIDKDFQPGLSANIGLSASKPPTPANSVFIRVDGKWNFSRKSVTIYPEARFYNTPIMHVKAICLLLFKVETAPQLLLVFIFRRKHYVNCGSWKNNRARQFKKLYPSSV